MISGVTTRVRAGFSWIGILLFTVVVSLLNASPAQAQTPKDCVADFNGLVDGNFLNPQPSQINIDGNCTFQHFSASNPLTSNISFVGNNPTSWLVIFNDVVFTGNMSCNLNSQGNFLWFTNGSTSELKDSCLNLLIPVEKIDKRNPPGPAVATIGIPFTYKLTIPVLFDPATGTVINNNGSLNDLHGITITDDLNATGASLTYVSHTAYWLNDGTPIPHTFSNVGGLLTFTNFPIIPAGRQFVIDVTVVLNDTPSNVLGNQFINTAKWEFGRLIGGTFYQPLPGEWGVTPPMTIAAPRLVMTKSGPPAMNLGTWGTFTLDIQNTGPIEAWNATLRDLFPDGPAGGMCDQTPEILSAQVFAADGVTPVPGKGPLSPGSGYLLNYNGAPACRLEFSVLTAQGTIGPNERLIVRYRTRLDANSQDGVALTNIAGAVQWFNGDGTTSTRVAFNRPLTDGTPAVADHEDDHTVTMSLTGYFFDKTVANITTGANPATTGTPGDTLRYTLRFRTTNQPLANVRIVDDLGALNGAPVFAPGTLTLVSYPAGADISATSSTGGTNGTGIVDIRNLTAPANGELLVVFDVRLALSISNGTVVTNQSTLLSNGAPFTVSDDPNVNGLSDPFVSGDEDPTRLTVQSGPLFRVQKTSTDLTADPTILLAGERLRYTITVKNIGNADAVNVTLRDAVPANTTYVAGSTTLNGAPVADVAGVTPLVNGMAINSPANGTPGTMPADATSNPGNVATITFDVVVNANVVNGTVLSNQGFVTASASGIVDHPSDDPDTAIADDPTLDIVGVAGYVFEKTVADLTSGVSPATTAVPGDTLRYTLRFRTFNQAVTNVRILDDLGVLNGGPVFAPGSLTLVSYPAGADISATSSTGGTNGTGIVDIRNLSVPANGEIVIVFDVRLATGLANRTVISNQSSLRLASGPVFAVSDDPNVNGPANPAVAGDEDLTRVTIQSAAEFRFQKISTDLTGDPNVLMAGERLRYTITVKNIGNGNASGVTLRDLVPANTTYVAGSTTLNGTAVADIGGLSPLVNGMLIHSPADTTPGSMPANPSSTPANVATITFDVIVNPNVINGTVISNQGFVTAATSEIVDYPSDDPATPTVNDPTRDIVGNLPLLYADKRVVLVVDLGSPGVVDPGDVLRYTITVQNSAASPATGVVLRDALPVHTTYVANSTRLNGLPVGQPDGGVSPLASGINISSSNLTPPLPGAGAGTISPGGTAVLQFDLRVNPGTPAGTVITNQAVVDSVEVADLPTDGDGNPSTGPEPTVVVVGDGQQLSITKTVSVIGGGAAVPGAQLEYVVRVVNIGATPAINVVVTDNLDAPQPGQLAFVSGSATMNGLATGVTFSGSTITANYGALNGPLPAGEVVVLRFRATLNPSLPEGTAVTNTGVVTWNSPTQTASASVSISVGGIPGFAVLSGSAWHDADFDDTADSGERMLAGWAVDLYRDGQLLYSGLTDAAGLYRIIGVEPNDVSGRALELRFRAPGAGASTAMLGQTVSPFTNGMQRISNIVVTSGANLRGLNLPIHPNGVVYNSMARIPVVGATLTLLDARSATPLPVACFADAAQQGQVTLAAGYYKFDVTFSDPACPSGGTYLIAVTPPAGSSYVSGNSQIIPPASSASTAAFSVPSCPASPADAIPGTALFCEAQRSEFAPTMSVPARSAGTVHYVHVLLDGTGMPGTSQIFNNHIPLDPNLEGSISVTKTTPLLNVTRGQQVPYTITVNNRAGLLLTDMNIVDRVPAGFTYVPGSARLDGVPAEPSIAGQDLSWSGLVIAGTEVRRVRLLLTVGAGVTEAEYVNRAQAVNGLLGTAMSEEATATVRVVPDPTFDCTDVTGKVFKDTNRNGLQDDGEEGLAGVRVVTAQGLEATTDQYGRYHITCAIVPNENRGSNFVLKLDDRTLPTGFRMSTDQTQVKRATRGKAVQVNFGASVHRVVGIDLSDAVFEPGATDIRLQWRPRVNALLDELRKSPAVLRLSYVADTEDAALVERRMQALERQLLEMWNVVNDGYVLTIEPVVFWRRGAPPRQPAVRVPGSR